MKCSSIKYSYLTAVAEVLKSKAQFPCSVNVNEVLLLMFKFCNLFCQNGIAMDSNQVQTTRIFTWHIIREVCLYDITRWNILYLLKYIYMT